MSKSSESSLSVASVLQLLLISVALLLLTWISWSIFTPKIQVKDSHGILVQPGDVISFHRGYYNHIALAVDGATVVHLTGDGQDFDLFGVSVGSSGGTTYATVRHDAILKVAGKDNFYISNQVWDKSLKTRDEVVRLALSRLGEKRTYNLATGNCEHFVNELILEKASSQQVMGVVSKLLCLLIGLVAVKFRVRILYLCKFAYKFILNKSSESNVNETAKCT